MIIKRKYVDNADVSRVCAILQYEKK